MHYHIILTERCNLRCKYCYEKSMEEFDNGLNKKWDYDMETPVDSEVSVDGLKKFLKSGDTLIFYGGEPLVKLEKIKEIVNGFENSGVRFCIQTNGILLNKIPEGYLFKLDKMLVSIDGTGERTDESRGKGTYDRVLKNVKEIRSKGYKGEIVARMVISKSDVFDQVKHLLDLGIFDSVHWQIDAGFYKNDFDLEKFSKFVEEYNPSIEKLLNYWVSEIKEGRVLKLYPFLGIFRRLMGWDENKKLPCGSGHSNFTINTSGKLSACPIMNSVKNLYCGSIDSGIEKEINIKHEDCLNCGVFEICGGRCLYWREAELWPKEGDDLICDTIKYLVEGLKKKIPKIKKLIDSGTIMKEDFLIESYFGPEIIP